MKIITTEIEHCYECAYAGNKTRKGWLIVGKYKCQKKNKTLPDIWKQGEIPGWCPLGEK